MLNNPWFENLNTKLNIYYQNKVYLKKTNQTLDWESKSSERFYLLIKIVRLGKNRFETPKFGF